MLDQLAVKLDAALIGREGCRGASVSVVKNEVGSDLRRTRETINMRHTGLEGQAGVICQLTKLKNIKKISYGAALFTLFLNL
jgi:hypothetical protein